MKHYLFLFALIFHLVSNSQINVSDDILLDSRDGQNYTTIKIGEQVWMSQNLNYETDNGSWVYNNEPIYSEQYGRLYNWKAARKACPDGWHLPSQKDFQILFKNFNGSDEERYKALIVGGKSQVSFTLGGLMSPENKVFIYTGMRGAYWTSTKYGIEALGLAINGQEKFLTLNSIPKDWAFSVRCIKD